MTRLGGSYHSPLWFYQQPLMAQHGKHPIPFQLLDPPTQPFHFVYFIFLLHSYQRFKDSSATILSGPALYRILSFDSVASRGLRRILKSSRFQLTHHLLLERFAIA